MTLNPINHSVKSPSLFRPVPASELQQNLAEHFQRTAEFVDENFQAVRNTSAQKASENVTETEPQEKRSLLRDRIRPAGLGGRLDIFV